MINVKQIDYLALYERWIAFQIMPEEDHKTLLNNLHEEVKAGIETLGNIATSEMERVLSGVVYSNKLKYLESVAIVLSMSALTVPKRKGRGHSLVVWSRIWISFSLRAGSSFATTSQTIA